jgi:hypothetical protein
MVQLAQVVVIGTPPSAITFPSIPAGYAALKILAIGQFTAAVDDDNLWMLVNGDTTAANYSNTLNSGNKGNTGVLTNTIAPTVKGVVIGQMPGTTGANCQGSTEITIVGYDQTTRPTIFQSLSAERFKSSQTDILVVSRVANYTVNAPITSLTFQPNTGNFAAGVTVFTLFGVGGPAVVSGPPLGFFSGNYTTPLAASWSFSANPLSSLTDQAGRMKMVAASSATLLHTLSNALPAPPYTLDFIGGFGGTPLNGSAATLGLQVNDGTKYRAFYIGMWGTGSNTHRLDAEVDSWTNSSTFSASVTSLPVGMAAGGLNGVRITDDGTTRAFWVTANGLDYVKVYQEPTNTFVASNMFGGLAFFNSSPSLGSPAFNPDAKGYCIHFKLTAAILGDSP